LKQVIKKFTTFSLLLLLASFLIYSCNKTPLDRNPFLADVRFQREFNLSLPLYSGLNYVGGSIFVEEIGINGIILFNLNGSNFLAWEATCPNHLPQACSKLSIEGVLAICKCEEFQYSLATGQLLNPSEGLSPPQSLLFYQVQNYNGILNVSN
jgi:nitrite reductase/ring-hydroxylating ferredoxin subunit